MMKPFHKEELLVLHISYNLGPIGFWTISLHPVPAAVRDVQTARNPKKVMLATTTMIKLGQPILRKWSAPRKLRAGPGLGVPTAALCVRPRDIRTDTRRVTQPKNKFGGGSGVAWRLNCERFRFSRWGDYEPA